MEDAEGKVAAKRVKNRADKAKRRNRTRINGVIAACPIVFNTV